MRICSTISNSLEDKLCSFKASPACVWAKLPRLQPNMMRVLKLWWSSWELPLARRDRIDPYDTRLFQMDKLSCFCANFVREICHIFASLHRVRFLYKWLSFIIIIYEQSLWRNTEGWVFFCRPNNFLFIYQCCFGFCPSNVFLKTSPHSAVFVLSVFFQSLTLCKINHYS